MATWNEFAAQEPDLAATVRRLFGLDARGAGRLEVVGGDGMRNRTVAPVLSADNLYLVLPPDADEAGALLGGAPLALHAGSGDASGEAVLAGTAGLIVYAYEREAVLRAAGSTDPEDLVFRLDLGEITLSAADGSRESRSLRR